MAVTTHPGDGEHGVSRLHGCVQIQRKLHVSNTMLALAKWINFSNLTD